MPFSFQDFVASGGQTNFAFSIPYLSRDHITVYKNGTALVFTTDWSFLAAQTVQLVVGAALNDAIRVRRFTPIDEPIVDFVNGSVLDEADLDSQALQVLYAAQEVADESDNTLRANASLRWDALGRRIINLGTPVDPGDAVRKDFADAQVAAASASATAAATSATNAGNSATAASASATTASTQAGLATTARIAAELAETNAETAEVNAELAETNAETAEANAEAAEINAAASAVAAAASAAQLIGTSVTSNLIATGSKSFVTQAGKFFSPGTALLITSDANPSNYMHGHSTVYAGTALTVNVTNIGGSGTFSDWTIRVSGTQGATGNTGATGPQGPQGIQGPTGAGSTVITQEEGVQVANRPRINFIGAGVTAVDNAGSDRVDVTIPGGSSGHIIAVDNAAQPQRATLDFITVNSDGLTITPVDNPGNNSTELELANTAPGHMIQKDAVDVPQPRFKLNFVGSQVTTADNVANLSTDVTVDATDANLTTTDVTTNNVTSTKHGFAPKSPANAALFLNGAATPTYTDPVAADSVTFAKIQNIATDRLVGRDTAATGDPEEITVGGGLEFSGAGGIQSSAYTGDVTKAAGSTVQTIANDAVTYAKMQNVSAAAKLLGRGSAAGAGDPEEITLGTNLSMSGTTLNATGGGASATRASVHRNGTDQTAIVSGVETKVLFTTEHYDVGAAFDTGANSRWTPGTTGYAMIQAAVAWSAIANAIEYRLMIFKNGAVHKEIKSASGAAIDDWSMNISAVVEVGVNTDYFEIFVEHVDTVNRIIVGNNARTWAMFTMI